MPTSQQIQNIRSAITVMERVKTYEQTSGLRQLYMCTWQSLHDMPIDLCHNAPLPVAQSEDDLHKCGYQACFGGHIAVAKEFQALGIVPDSKNGSPRLHPERQYESTVSVMRELFGWDTQTSKDILFDSKDLFTPGETHSGDVTTTQVIGWLKERLAEVETVDEAASWFEAKHIIAKAREKQSLQIALAG